MKNIINVLLISVLFTGCYSSFDEPSPDKVWTHSDFEGQIMSIKDFKELFYDEHGSGSGSLGQTLIIEDDIVVTGRVISNDKAGNVYKSLYIYDEVSESAIELRLNVSNNVYYHVGQRVFVKAKGLAIGSYRYMLSIGMPPSEWEVNEGYANSNLEDRVTISKHILQGELATPLVNDTLVVNASNYKTVLDDSSLGRLVRFEGLKSIYTDWGGNNYPSYLEVVDDVYTDKTYEGNPTWSYNYDGLRYYGSSLFSFTDGAEVPMGQEETAGTYIVRVSGYANFALKPIPEDGAVGDITCIYTKYSSRSGGFVKYQMLLNSDADVNF